MQSIIKIKYTRNLLIGTFLLASASICLNAQNSIYFSIDLNKLNQDKLSVQVKTPKFKQSQIDFLFPKIVPGTYANYDFGRYISDFKAFDKDGKNLTVSKKGVNQYQIKNAQRLHLISYQVDDTWDSPEIEGDYVFEPAGTSFQKDTLFALNTHGFLGYFKGFEKNKIELEINKPAFMVGTSSLKSEAKSNATKDVFLANSYYEMVDSPFMYAKPDTISLKIAQTEIAISVFSPNKTLRAEEIALKIKPLLEAQKNYLGGILPIKRYAFLIVLSDNLKNGSYGALEHAKSSFYYLPEGDINNLAQTILDVCAHEFFHIVTPLNIHSEEIGNFDFNQPKMSKHLWLYEGLTEYAAHHMQVKYGLIKLPQFMQTIQEKWETMQVQFDDKIPFTEMSKKVLDTYKDQYSNVYQKGALLGFGLDLLLRKESNGAYGTQQMMQDLAKIYGPNQSFKDDDLFDKLVLLTKNPNLKEYFNLYVAGNKKIPLNDWLNSIGYEIDLNKKDTVKTLGFDFQTLNINSETKRAYIGSESGINDLGNALLLQAKDELVSVNQLPIDLANFVKNTQQVLSKIKTGDLLALEIARPNGKGGFETIKLAAPFERTVKASRTSINELILPSKKQIKLREDWLKPNP
jgi:predicted metalloprotease with PDZ domain